MALSSYDWQRLKEVFADSRALPAERRPAYLADACDGNEALREEVESFWRRTSAPGAFSKRPL